MAQGFFTEMSTITNYTQAQEHINYSICLKWRTRLTVLPAELNNHLYRTADFRYIC